MMNDLYLNIIVPPAAVIRVVVEITRIHNNNHSKYVIHTFRALQQCPFDYLQRG